MPGQIDTASIRVDRYCPAVSTCAPQIAAHPFFEDPVGRALIAQPGGHLGKDTSRSVARIFYSLIN